MSEDTAQPILAAETGNAVEDAANAFKVHLGQAEAPRRAPDGKFAAAEPAEEIEAPEEAEEAEAVAETPELDEDEDGAAEEAQPEIALPHSWPPEKAEVWGSLPPEAQAVIAEREGQRDAAVNAKFQEAANVRKANEALVTEANTNRTKYAEAIGQVLALIQPQWPSPTMLDPNSGDYNPDEYHLRRAYAEQDDATVQNLAHQQQQIAAQLKAEEDSVAASRFHAINNATRDNFIKLVPDAADQAKAPGIFTELMEYAVSQGAPADLFQSPTTALEWTVLKKAMEYDRLMAAKAKVGQQPAPTPKAAGPAVRPGVATPRSATQAARAKGAMDRLARSGSIADGAAVWKNLMKSG